MANVDVAHAESAVGIKTRSFRIILAQPRGFCAGVERAIEIVERALRKYGPPVYVRHEIVHNKHVVEDLRAKGACFVEEIDEIPDGAVTVFSAHGVAESVDINARLRGLPVLDATCPLVSKVHREGQRYAKNGYEVILIGHDGHPEVEGTMGRIPGGVKLVSSVEDVTNLEVEDSEKVAYVTQTTLSVDDTRAIIDALTERFPSIAGPNVRDICYATQNRQAAVRQLAQLVDLLLVVGARNSSNSSRLMEIGIEMGVRSYLIGDAGAIAQSWLEDVDVIGLTAGASAPEALVQEVISKLNDFGSVTVEAMDGVSENISFKLPRELQDAT